MDVSKIHSDKGAGASGGLSSVKSGSAARTEKSTEATENQNARGVSQNTSEKVKWSPDANLALEALGEAKRAPDARADKVAALKAAIKDGSYKVDSHKLADRMIEASLEEDLLTRKA